MLARSRSVSVWRAMASASFSQRRSRASWARVTPSALEMSSRCWIRALTSSFFGRCIGDFLVWGEQAVGLGFAGGRHGHEGKGDFIERGLRLRADGVKGGLGSATDGPFNLAELLVGGEGELPSIIHPLRELAQGVLQQREGVGLATGRGQQLLIESLLALGIPPEREPCEPAGSVIICRRLGRLAR